MGKLVISHNVTLDGVGQDPTGEEGFARGGWFPRGMTAEDREAWDAMEFAEALAAEAMLMGRITYEFFVARWPLRQGEWADRLNSMPKYVVSSTLEHLDWRNTTVLCGDAAKEVANLKHQLRGEIVLYGSARLAQTVIEHDLVDELRLIVYPFVLGAGTQLFASMSATRPMRLRKAQTLGTGLVHLSYERVDAAEQP